MKRNSSMAQPNLPSSQQGMVLIVGLVMVLLMSVIGLAAIRGAGLQEAMAGNMNDKNIAFQAAESGLRVCEVKLSPANKTVPPPKSIAGAGSTLDLNQTPANSVLNSDFWIPLAFNTALNLPDITDPICLIEELNANVDSAAAATGGAVGVHGLQALGVPLPYRVSALGTGPSTNPAVTQSTYNRRFN
ncbi:MAG: PilX N-terminal domain-containing pilus assembly protein [Pseudomonadota bacterium]